MSQSSMEVPAHEPLTGPCAWCGETTRLKLVLAKARYTTAANGARVMAKPAHEVWCCQRHQQSLVMRGDS